MPSENLSGGDRRNFLASCLAVLGGAAAGAVPALAGLAAFLNPWREKSEAGRSIRVASLASLTVGGPPMRVPVIADRRDAWNRFAAEPIGAVFLRRTGEKQVVAVSVVCPHAGCQVAFDGKQNGFFCPCHAAKFDADGKRTEAQSMSPRDLDTLDVEIKDTEVWVKFERFRTGTAEKVTRS
jgi:Rieske Fe-S protein